jgi:hypothetical protein
MMLICGWLLAMLHGLWYIASVYVILTALKGVTMVGIHERSSREKIFSNQIAHVLNDETQRKYIQALKRIMSFVQRAYPTDPSKTVG